MVKFDLVYINLDRAEARRKRIEQSIADSRFSNRWSFFRFSAVSADSELVRSTPGKLSGPYKGNLLSHLNCLRLTADRDAHLFVAEDDVEFSGQTGRVLEELVDGLPEDSWDIIRTEITAISAADFPKIYKLCASETGRESVRLLKLGGLGIPLFGASAYLVNRNARLKFSLMVEAMVKEEGGMFDVPFDAYLCDLVEHKFLRGFVTLPFLTAPSVYADESQAPQVHADRPPTADEEMAMFNKVYLQLITAFRRLVWIGYSPDKVWAEGIRYPDSLFGMTERDRQYRQLSTWLLRMQQNIPYKSDYQLEPGPVVQVVRKPAG